MSSVISETRPHRKQAPMVKGLPIVGSLKPMLENPHAFIAKAYKKHGEIFRFKVAHRDYIVLSGVDATRFLAGEGKDYFGVDGFWGKAFEYMQCPHGIVGVDGEIHQHQRNLMKPLLSQAAFKDRVNELAEPVSSIIQNHQSAKLEVGPITRHMISNQIGFNLQGIKPDYDDVVEFIYYFSGVMNVFGLRKWPKLMLKTPRFLKAKKIANDHSKQAIKTAEQKTDAEKKQCPHYLDTILPELRRHPEWYGVGEEEMHGTLPFIAALDTVASTMGFMLKRLLENPELKKRVQAEVDLVFSKGIPDLETLLAMEDLNGLVKETLRLQPTGFGITRTANQNFEYKGYPIKKGQDILLFTTADHLNSQYFPKPRKFDIERYREPRREHKQAVYAPYGKGPHMCLGAGMAEIMMPLNIGLMLYNWQISSACNLSKVKLTFNPAPVLSNNFRIKIKTR